MSSPASPLVGERSFERRTRSSATSAEIQHVSLASYSRPSKRTRKNSCKVEGTATGNVTAPTLPKPEESPPLGAVPKKRRRAKGDYADLGSDPLTDRIREELDVLFCGENPGIRTAETQLHCKAVARQSSSPFGLELTKALTPSSSRADASPHNHFYKAVHAAGLTPTVLEPSASRTFPEDYNIGITNLIPRPTREARPGWPSHSVALQVLTAVFDRLPNSLRQNWKLRCPSSSERSSSIDPGERRFFF